MGRGVRRRESARTNKMADRRKWGFRSGYWDGPEAVERAWENLSRRCESENWTADHVLGDWEDALRTERLQSSDRLECYGCERLVYNRSDRLHVCTFCDDRVQPSAGNPLNFKLVQKYMPALAAEIAAKRFSVDALTEQMQGLAIEDPYSPEAQLVEWMRALAI